ncbi:spore germination protein [Sutcliffiella cohnii]|uniref:spore germination protein n=1 Tax=Sutcliffiella cohnii TaxID=33932 RepID=UPI002E249832|nr:spore germination protein [Sutcliffiella cohnii]
MELLTTFTADYKQNITFFTDSFSFPKNRDVIIKEFTMAGEKKAALIYLRGMANEQTIETNLLENLRNSSINEYTVEQIAEISPVTVKNEVRNTKSALSFILNGDAVLIMEGVDFVLPFTTKKFEKRAIEQPEIERVTKGPKESFIESIDSNISLIRKQLRSPQLITEQLSVGGETEQSPISMLYIKGIANEELVEKVKNRIGEINMDNISNLSILEQHIEERSYSLIPTVMLTERPDRATAFLREGHVVLLMDSSPDCLVMPVTFWSFFHTAEDYYQRWPFGNLLRIIRLFAFFAALLAPAVFIAVTTYHIESIPTDLLFTFIATRELVPFPSVFELILLELTFDVFREAGLRMPSKAGPVVAMLAALIISIAAIESGLISPIVITVVGFSSLASFTIPTNSFVYAVRIARFGFIALAAIMGFFGIAIGVQACIAYLTTVKSFDVPFISPMAPHYPSSKDLLTRPPLWKMWLRSLHVYPLSRVRGDKPEGGKNQ